MPIKMDFDATASSNINFLRSIPEFRGISEDHIKSLAKVIERRVYKDQEVVFEEGAKGTHLFIVQDGTCVLEMFGKTVKHFNSGDIFGEIAIIGEVERTGKVSSRGNTVVLGFPARVLEDEAIIDPKASVTLFKELTRKITRYSYDVDAFYNDIDVLLIQDGGCAPGYNPVTGYITRFLEFHGRRVFIAREGFRSVVSGLTSDFNYMINDRSLYNSMEHVPGVIFAPVYREARGASFRSERYKEFIEEDLQKKAAQHIMERNVKVVVGIGGDGTFKGIRSLSQFLPDSIQKFFIPVTIDSDILGTECIGEHTGVQVGSEKIRSYMADARSHQRLYVIEMMGRDGGYHALRSCLGAGADMAVLPHFEYDIPAIAKALQKKQSAVIVVAEGYQRHKRKAEGFEGNAADYFLKELHDSNLDVKMRAISEGFSRDIRGSAPNYEDITLSQQMARHLAELVEEGKTEVMPAILGGKEYAIPFTKIQTDNKVSRRLADLANRLLH